MKGEKLRNIIWPIITIVLFIGIIGALIVYGEVSDTKEYLLYELDDGVYGVYTVVSSNVPANNYEMITLCINGQVRTFKGYVNIYYTDITYKLILEDRNYVNSDIMNVYVPSGSILYSTNVGIGSRG